MIQPTRRALLQGAAVAAAATALPATPALAASAGNGHDVALPGTSARDRAWARAVLSRMTLDEKVGQVFNQYLYGSSATEVTEADAAENLKLYGVRTPAEVVAKYHLGGATYFNWTHSVVDLPQVTALSNGLQRASLAANRGVPMTISVDQEHGAVARIGEPATLFPGGMALGATGSRAHARDVGRITGEELRALGITLDFAPDADVNVNPANPVIGVRSFGADPHLVARMVAAEVKGLQSNRGVSACAKHFPGHGDTATDSHVGLPMITHTRQQWATIDRPPFEAAIAAGVDVIMTAHLLVPALDDSGDPATLSRPIITGILRGELGFRGLVVTDGLQMQGVREKYGDGEVAVRALLAGADMLLMTPDMPAAWAAVHQAVASGRLPMARLEEAVLRNLQLKAKRGVVDRPYVDAARIGAVVGTRQNLRVADEVADDAITLLRNQGVLPLAARGARVALVGWSSGTTTHQVLADELRRRGAQVTTVTTGATPTDAQVAQAVAAAADAQVVVVTTYNVAAGSAQAKLVAALQATGRPVVVAALRNPYDIAHLPATAAFLATYSWQPVALRALVRAITGEHVPGGRLPVAVTAADGSELYPVGAGLQRWGKVRS